MSDRAENFNKIAIAFHPLNEAANILADQIGSNLEGRGMDVLLGKMDDDQLREEIRNGSQDLMMALGGDGTMLRAGHISAPSGTPILGINLGRYGFLTEVQEDDWSQAIDKVLNGNYWMESRMMLEATHFRSGKEIGS